MISTPFGRPVRASRRSTELGLVIVVLRSRRFLHPLCSGAHRSPANIFQCLGVVLGLCWWRTSHAHPRPGADPICSSGGAPNGIGYCIALEKARRPPGDVVRSCRMGVHRKLALVRGRRDLRPFHLDVHLVGLARCCVRAHLGQRHASRIWTVLLLKLPTGEFASWRGSLLCAYLVYRASSAMATCWASLLPAQPRDLVRVCGVAVSLVS